MSLFAPISQLQAMLFAIIALGFASAVLFVRSTTPRDDAKAKRDRSSYRGIIVQSLAIWLAALGPMRITLASTDPRSIISSAAALLLGAGAIGLFDSSARSLGQNWSVVARTRGDHRLVRSGPYARVRHPIYTSLFLLMLAFAVSLGHLLQLIAAIPLYLVGTQIRTNAEERLLEDSFGEEFRAYRAVTPLLFPKLTR